MLTTQESLEALAGRSPDGKPLVFVSQQDYEALRKKYESLLETTKQSKSNWRSKAWVVATAAIGIAIVVAVAYHPVASAHVEPYGAGFYTANDVAGVHAANAFCMARNEEKQMRPLYTLGVSGLLFECVRSADEVAARCVELRSQMEHAAADAKRTDPVSAQDAGIKLLDLDVESDALKCRNKP
jgi:hypothetical protein